MSEHTPDFVQTALEHVREHWGTAYLIGWDHSTRQFTAMRLHTETAPLLTADTARELLELIRRDYGPTP